MNITIAIGTGALLVSAAGASASIRITEYMYQGTNGGADAIAEFFEITNLSAAPVDLTGWSIDDNSRTAGSQSISALGILAVGESAVITEMAEATFRTRWNLGASIKVLGSNSQNLGRADEVNVYDSGGVLIDRVTFDDQTGKGIRTQGKSAWRFRSLGGGPFGDANSTWVASTVGDAQGSYKAVSPANADDIASPGTYVTPAPGVLALMGMGTLVAVRRKR